ncbi:MAG: two-component system, sensor histidine kinase and response regulator, partial [Baekduia sp.]|nr:two-component system, sensor histidine kinase and response regulator [Baekduia sp.]
MGKGARRAGLIGPTLAAFGVVMVLVSAIFAFLLYAVTSVRDDARAARESEQVVALTSRLNRLTIDLETGVRGRLLTGDDRFLMPYRDAQKSIPVVEDRLRSLVPPGAQQRLLTVLLERVETYRTGYAALMAGLPSATPRSDIVDRTRVGKAQL